MSCPPAELQSHCDRLQANWERVLAAPGFDAFIEFAVSLSSFSDFLKDKNLSGLHQMSHGLEQRTLALFDAANAHPMTADQLLDLRHQMEALTARVSRFIDSNSRRVAHRRTHQAELTVSDLSPPHRVWLVGDTANQWRALMTQLEYFNIRAEVFPWQSVPTDAEEPAILLLDVRDVPVEKVCERVQALRTRFSASKLIVNEFPVDFNNLKAALRAGCDFCFAQATAQPVILAKIIELCSTEEELPYRVLVVEDSLTARKSIERTLNQSGIETLAVADPSEVLSGLRSFGPDLILMDMYMPDCTGVEATRVIRQHAEFLSTPVIYLSGEGDIALQVDALRLGGEHFLTKPFNPVFLNAVVKSKIERYRALRRSMLYDGLTGLLNHRTIKEKLKTALEATSLSKTPLAVAMIDIDYFKTVNDQYGHPMGDQVLRSLAWLLRQRLRKTDLIGRYGGEEFLVALPGSDIAQAFDVLDRIRRDFSLIHYPYHDHGFDATFSAGLAQFPGSIDAETLIRDADEALYEAKNSGRNCILSQQ